MTREVLGAVGAEWTKLRTVPAGLWAMIALVAGLAAAVRLEIVQVAAVALAVVAVSGEYQPRVIRVTLALRPRRLTVFAAKAVVVSGVCGVGLLVAAPGAVRHLTLVALLGVGVAMVVRHAGAAIGVVVAALYGPYLVTLLAPMSARAAAAIRDAAPMTGGSAVLAAYAAGALLAGGVLVIRRDA